MWESGKLLTKKQLDNLETFLVYLKRNDWKNKKDNKYIREGSNYTTAYDFQEDITYKF